MGIVKITIKKMGDGMVYCVLLEDISIIYVSEFFKNIYEEKHDFKKVTLSISVYPNDFCYMSILVYGISKDDKIQEFFYSICKYEIDLSVYIFFKFLKENLKIFENICNRMDDTEMSRVLRIFLEAVKRIDDDSDMKKTVAKFLLLLKLLS